MERIAIYRKYRPSTFEDLLGQPLVVEILREAARRNALAHAYLLAGPRGTGKTTTARLIAKIANCLTRKENATFRAKGEPCNACTACKEIDSGKSFDVVEIDAASNRGIDEIRNLKENVRVTPSSLQYKVFIIDEAHMLTKEAFNALLKTLEEPPAYVLFILATTETDKIPETIASRTQQFYFKRIPLESVAKKLHSIAKEEKVSISQEALDLIAAAGEGSFRDAESLLDQLITFSEKEITLENVERTIGKVGFHKISGFAEYLLQHDMEKALEELSDINENGYNLTEFTKDLIHYFRRVAVLHYNPHMETLFAHEFMAEHLAIIKKHSGLFQEPQIQLLKLLIEAYGQMRYSQFPIIPLEIAIIESTKK